MAEVKIRQMQSVGNHSTETTFEAKDIDRLDEDLIKGLFGTQRTERAEKEPGKEIKLADIPTAQPGLKCEVVAIYDNAGIPSIMRRFTKTTDKELFGGSEKTHPAFIIGGVEYDEIYLSVYPNCEINGKPYSLPYQKPWTNITNDDAAKACFSKGEGWHLLTAAEWGLLADTSLMLGTLPHGNTNGGKYHADPEEHGEEYDNSSKTLTGSGPAAWTHDHTPEGDCRRQRITTQHWTLTSHRRATAGSRFTTTTGKTLRCLYRTKKLQYARRRRLSRTIPGRNGRT